ncbi:MAG: beta-galactosidase [Phycisphaerae bacterium]
MRLRGSRRITGLCGQGGFLFRVICGRCCCSWMPALLAAFVFLEVIRGFLVAASESAGATRPVSRMGDPWGMIYGGSGWREHNNPHRTNIAERAAAGAKEMAGWGVQASRVGICWHDVERERGTYDWTMPDAVIPAVAKAGIHVVLCVATTPRWAWQHPSVEAILIERRQENLAGCLPHKPEFWPDYERYLAEVVKRYGRFVKHYEIWNEPDGLAGFRFMEPEPRQPIGFQHGGDPVWYAELVKRSYGIIKSLDPPARVCVGSYEHKKAMEPFVLDPSTAASLAEGRASDAVRRAFGGHPDAPLSTSATIRIEVPDCRWIVNDDRNGR